MKKKLDQIYMELIHEVKTKWKHKDSETEEQISRKANKFAIEKSVYVWRDQWQQ